MRTFAVVIFCLLFAGIASAQETYSYRYDAQGRLIQVSRSGGPADGVQANYDYDKAGNRTNATVTGVPLPSGNVLRGEIGNFSFEMPEQDGSFTYNPLIQGMNFSGNSGIAANGSAWAFPSAPDGDQIGFLQTGVPGVIDVGVTGLEAGLQYMLRFSAARRPGRPTNTIHISADGNYIGFATPTDIYQEYAIGPFTTGGSRSIISFAIANQSVDTASAIDRLLVDTVSSPSLTVANSSFERPNVGSGFQYTPSSDGVVFDRGTGVAANGSAWGLPSAPAGKQVAFMQSSSSSSAQLSLRLGGMAVGSSYRIRFYASHRPNYGLASIILSVDGQPIMSVTPTDGFSSYLSSSFIASAATMTLTLVTPAGNGGAPFDDNGVAVDAIELIAS